ncbi:MAG: ABC transporter permease [Anaerolineales bacterium]|nr:ABC transporter permease [Anaerolineales bacterium]
MAILDLISLILDNLARRTARVALTAVGVVIGTAAVVVLVSLGIGLQQSASENLYGIGDLTLIQVSPKYGEPFPAPIPGGPAGSGPPNVTLITNQSLADFAAIPGVVSVAARDFMQGEGRLSYNRLEAYAGPLGMGVQDLGVMGWSAQGGELTLERGTMVIGAMIAGNFYNPSPRPNQETPPPPDLLGQSVKMSLIKYDEEGNQVIKSFPVRIGGVIAERGDEVDWSTYMSLEDVNSYNEWFSGRRTNRDQVGYNSAVVKVSDPNETVEAYDRILEMGYEAYTPQSFLQPINSFYLIMQIMFGGVGAIALLVAAIGIANTMAMAILERTREIGLMKAIGATNRDVLAIFLGEAAGIGLIGGLGGVLVGWSMGQLFNVLALVYMAGQWSQQGGAPPANIAVITPIWLLAFSIGFATLIGLLSGIYPALRAANLIPVEALKYE